MSYTPSILFATVDTLPGANYQVIGLVSGSTQHASLSGSADLSGAYKDMEEAARRLGGHAVIGVRVATSQLGGMGASKTLTVLVGSAIKFLS